MRGHADANGHYFLKPARTSEVSRVHSFLVHESEQRRGSDDHEQTGRPQLDAPVRQGDKCKEQGSSRKRSLFIP